MLGATLNSFAVVRIRSYFLSIVLWVLEQGFTLDETCGTFLSSFDQNETLHGGPILSTRITNHSIQLLNDFEVYIE